MQLSHSLEIAAELAVRSLDINTTAAILPCMRSAISFALSNFTLTCLVIGLIHTAARLLRSRVADRDTVIEAFFAPFLLYSIGISFLYNFVMHVFFGDMTARFIGWQPSPFQPEVGHASLGFAVIGLCAVRGSRGLRIAAVVGPACFLLGAAVGHVQQMIAAHDFAPGNAGVIFYTDIALPLIGFALLALSRDHSGTAPEAAVAGAY